MRNSKLIAMLFLSPLVVFVIATLVFVANGGFGGGHGKLDRLVGLLAMPWLFVPWPHAIYSHDYIWLVAVPLVCNSLVLAIVAVLYQRRFRYKESRADG